jgi:hypothetical protein
MEAELSTFYVQNGAFKKGYETNSYEIAAQMAILDIVEQDNWQFAPFIVVSEEELSQETVDALDDINDEMKLLLTYNVVKSIAGYVEVDGEEYKAWMTLASTLEEATFAFDGGDKYHDLVHDLI